MAESWDSKLYKEICDYGEHLRMAHGERDKMQDEMEDLYLMDWGEEEEIKKRVEGVRVTKSVDIVNAFDGAFRLMAATDPTFSIPMDMDQPDAKAVSERLETMAKTMWKTAGRIVGDPLHYDVLRSVLLWDEAHILVSPTADLVKHAEGASPAVVQRAEEAAERTPYLFDVTKPYGFPEWDRMGLRAFYSESEVLWGQVEDEFGKYAKDAREWSGAKGDKISGRFTTVTLCKFYDLEMAQFWIKGAAAPILQEEHGLPVIPIATTLGEGSRLFSDPEDQRRPFLYKVWKSGLNDRANLGLTVLFTLAYALGATPMFVEERASASSPLTTLDNQTMFGRWVVPAGNKFAAMEKNWIPTGLQQAIAVAEGKIEQSTLFRQALGQPMEGSSTYSELSLLSQSGRLPLGVSLRKAGWAIGNAMLIAFKCMRQKKGEYKANYEGRTATLSGKDIPKLIEMEVKLEVGLPQDRLALANVSRQLKELGISDRWIMENIIQVGQADAMIEEAWSERAAGAYFEQYVQGLLQGQPGTQAPGQPGQPGGGGGQEQQLAALMAMLGSGGGGVPGGGGPGMTAGMAQGGLPAVMAQGGQAGMEEQPGAGLY